MALFVGENFAWTNVPKHAGKYVNGLFDSANVQYKKLGKGHKVVDTNLNGLPVVAHVRHPVTFLASLWCHRQRSDKPWQPDEYETGVGVDNWLQFVNNVCEHQDWVYGWIHRMIDPYNNIRIFRIEDGVWEQWVNFFDEIGESYDRSGAIAYRNQQVNVRTSETSIVLAQLTKSHYDKIYKTQKLMYETYGYTKKVNE